MILFNLLFIFLAGISIFILLPFKERYKQYISILLFIIFSLGLFINSVETFGRPKVIAFEWRQLNHAKVLGSFIVENKNIYVLLLLDGAAQPSYYSMPYSTESAQQLQDATSESQANGEDIRLDLYRTTEGIDDRPPKFYAEPQKPNPDKDYDNSQN